MTVNNEEVTKLAQDLVKRYSAAHKAAIVKAAHHLDLAKAAHSKGMTSLKKAAKCMVDANKTAKAAATGDFGEALAKAADDMAANMSDAHDHFNTAASSMDDVSAHLGSAMSAWGGNNTSVDPNTDVGGKVNIPGLTDLTEGDVPWYDSAMPYGEKLAKFKTFVKNTFGIDLPDPKKVTVVEPKAGMVTMEQAEKMAKDAAEKATAQATNEALTKQVEALTKANEQLARMPVGMPRVKAFDPAPLAGTGADNQTKLQKLLKGVDIEDLRDPDKFNESASKMLGNMIGDRFSGGNSFGKNPIFDGNFHGAAGRGRGSARTVVSG